MATLKGSETEKNLVKTFAGDSQARNRYNFFASVAKKEGYEQIAGNFNETAEQEKEHAKRMFKFLEGGSVEITAAYPSGIISSKTIVNLQAAAEGENEEWTELYPACADTAEAEGFKEIAEMYRMIAVAEKNHEERYRQFLQNIQEGLVFRRPEESIWVCRNCGFVWVGKEAPTQCPACQHPQAYFELKKTNF